MRRLLVVLLLAAASAGAQTPVNVVDYNLSATRPLPTQLSNGSAFIVPVLDATLTARFPSGSTPADNESNGVTITRSGAFLFTFDGATWDRWTGAVSQAGTWNVGTLTSITNPVAVTGTFWQATQPISGTVTANAGSGTFAVSGPLTDTQLRATAVPVSGTFWQATQPVSGTLAATQSGTWTVQPGNTPNSTPWLFSIHDGTTKAAVFNLAANDPLAVAIVDGSGSQITSFGGGTQYTEADTDASVTGTAVMWEDAADTLRVASAAKPLPVNVVAGGAGDGSIQDGASPSIEATVLDYTNSNPLAVRLTDTSGDYVGAGAGTQYADGAAVGTPTGTVALGHDGSNVRAITTDAAGDLQVDVITMPTTTVTGTVTANAGTGTMAVSGPLTDAQLRATAVPVSGTVTVTDGAGALNVIVDSATLGTVTVSDGAGAVNTIVDSGTLTAVTSITNAVTVAQATASSLNATVTDGSGALTVDGTVTANAGTNLNTSALLTTTAHDAAFGTAGAADAQVRTVQGIAGGTAVPVSGTFWQATQPVSGTFWQTTQPVSAASLPLPTGASTLAEQQTQTTALQLIDNLPNTQGSTTSGQSGVLTLGAVTTSAPTYTTAQSSPLSLTTTGSLRVDLVASSATGAAPPAQAMYTAGLGSGATGGFLLGLPICDTFANVNVSTATTTLLVTGVSGRHVRICSLSLVTAAANNVALISGTGATCGTGTTGMNGGTTAASGWNFAANGGLTQGSGIGTINQTNATGDSVCVVTSAATQLSGRLSYTIY